VETSTTSEEEKEAILQKIGKLATFIKAEEPTRSLVPPTGSQI
jgi:hypothetical protein